MRHQPGSLLSLQLALTLAGLGLSLFCSLSCVIPTSVFMVLFYDMVYWFFLVMEGTHPHKFPILSPNTKVSGDERQQENQGPLPL